MDGRPVSRRRLLGYAGLGATAFALNGARLGSAAAAGPSGNPSIEGYDDGSDRIPGGLKGDPERVIIVGAGFAGLAAANALRNAGVDCVVLEGRDRAGGRADTRMVGDTPVDLGASWIHEPEGNPMARLAAQAGVGRTPASPELDALTVLLHDDRVGDVADSDKLAAYLKAVEFDEERAAIGQSLGRTATYRDGAERFLDDHGIEGDQRRWVSFVIRLYAELEGAKSWEFQPLSDRRGTLSHPAANHPEFTGEGLGDFPKGGYHRVVKALAARTDIRYRHRVTGVEVTGTGVEVHTGRRTFKGSHALVTLPLGVLKAGGIKFSPRLPEAKRKAIRTLGFGNFEKVALTFDHPFWQDGGHTHLLHVGRGNTPRFPMFLDLQRFEGKPTLVSLNAGAAARNLVAGGAGAARRDVMKLLRRVYGASVPAPEAVAVTNWMNDPFALGSYSAVVMKTNGDERARLAAPVKGRLLFAGEATNLDGRPSTTDGAFTSGIREAKRLLRTGSVRISA